MVTLFNSNEVRSDIQLSVNLILSVWFVNYFVRWYVDSRNVLIYERGKLTPTKDEIFYLLIVKLLSK